MFLLNWFAVGLLILAPALPQDAPAAEGKKQTQQKSVRGSFDQKGDRVGFMLIEGRIFLKAILIHEAQVQSGIFLLDSALTKGCVLEKYFARKMGIEGLAQVTVKLGDCSFEAVQAMMLDRAELRGLFKKHAAVFQNQPICGVLGLPVLLQRKSTLDFARCTLSFPAVTDPVKSTPAVPAEAGKEEAPVRNTGWSVPYRIEAQALWVEAVLNGKEPGHFQLGTGSARSWVLKEAAEKMGVRSGEPPAQMVLANKKLAQPPGFEIRAPSEPLPNVAFPVTGILGTDFLIPFIVTIDPEASVMHLVPRPKR